jgi:hypothetical protein
MRGTSGLPAGRTPTQKHGSKGATHGGAARPRSQRLVVLAKSGVVFPKPRDAATGSSSGISTRFSRTVKSRTGVPGRPFSQILEWQCANNAL